MPLRDYWFWAYLVEMTIPKAGVDKPAARVEVWTNLVIIKATDASQALSKAWKLGEADEGDADGTLLLDGKPAITKFLGVQSIGLIHEELGDGCEVTFYVSRCTQKSAQAMIRPTKELLQALNKELGPSLRLGKQTR